MENVEDRGFVNVSVVKFSHWAKAGYLEIKVDGQIKAAGVCC